MPGGTLAATEITKSHGADVVLDGVTLVVPPRARIGVVGPNGAGKTTLLRVLAGLEEPDSGRVSRRPGDLTVRYLAQQREQQGRRGCARRAAGALRFGCRRAAPERADYEHARASERAARARPRTSATSLRRAASSRC